MPALTILYWRDIPAQVIAKEGRKSARSELSPRFTEAIDAAAMRAGLTDSDTYLAEWRKGAPSDCPPDLDKAVAEAIAMLERAYDAERLKGLIANGGKDTVSM